jgi:hypothetical protein
VKSSLASILREWTGGLGGGNDSGIGLGSKPRHVVHSHFPIPTAGLGPAIRMCIMET